MNDGLLSFIENQTGVRGFEAAVSEMLECGNFGLAEKLIDENSAPSRKLKVGKPFTLITGSGNLWLVATKDEYSGYTIVNNNGVACKIKDYDLVREGRGRFSLRFGFQPNKQQALTGVVR